MDKVCECCGKTVLPDNEGISIYHAYEEKYYCDEECWLNESDRMMKEEVCVCENCSMEIIHEDGEVYYDSKKKRHLCQECAMSFDDVVFYMEDEDGE